MVTPRRPARSILHAAGALLLGLALCEFGLRAGGYGYLVVHGRSTGDARLGPEGITLVCMGDSNTFGVYEDGRDSYPAQLEALLDERMPGGPHRVVNLGIPGMNTRQVLNALPEALETYAPDAVLVLAGVNNTWSWTDDSAVEYAAPPWYEQLRLAKLARVLWSRAGSPRTPEVVADLGGGEGIAMAAAGPDEPTLLAGRDRAGRSFAFASPPVTRRMGESELALSIERDVRAIAAAAEEHGTPLVLLTYAIGVEPQGTVNELVRGLSLDVGATLVDAERAVAPFEPRFGRQRLFYADTHPKALAYKLVARAAYNGLVEADIARGLPFPTLDEDLAAPDPWSADFHTAQGTAAGAPPVLEVLGEEPGRPIMFLLSGTGAGPRAWLGELELPLRNDEIFRLSALDPRLRSVVGEDGSARIELAAVVPATIWADLTGQTLQAACVVLHRHGSARARRVSSGLAIAIP